MITELWNKPATIAVNGFKHKSLSDWSYNIAVGCAHKCRFCYVPQVSTIRMSAKLETMGVDDPDAQWGDYVFPRQWHEGSFLTSLRKAERTPKEELTFDGNRAVMFCTTTDPYQVLPGEMGKQVAALTRNALKLILEQSTLNVRILTRSPLARQDFDLMKQFGNRLLFGMSLPTLDNELARLYEPHAPAPTQRLETLRRAKATGLNVYVAMAPTYPECDEADLERTMRAVIQLDPVTIYHEPINIRAENVARMEAEAKAIGKVFQSAYFTPEAWPQYAISQLFRVEKIAASLHLERRLHLWPDDCLKKHLTQTWLDTYWKRVSEWPK